MLKKTGNTNMNTNMNTNITITNQSNNDFFNQLLTDIDSAIKSINKLISKEIGYSFSSSFYLLNVELEDFYKIENPVLYSTLENAGLLQSLMFFNGEPHYLVANLDITYDGLNLESFLNTKGVYLRHPWIELISKTEFIKKFYNEYLLETTSEYLAIVEKLKINLDTNLIDTVQNLKERIRIFVETEPIYIVNRTI